MKFAYADPPYIGQAKKLYACAEIDYAELADVLKRCNASQERNAATIADLRAELARVKRELEEAKCGEALCGHDHSTQYWELRSNKAECKVRELEAHTTALRAMKE